MKRDFLLEIGCENLPSGAVDEAVAQLERIVGEGLASERIPFESIRVLGTPRRLVVHVASLGSKQEGCEERVIGPPVKVAVGPDGAYTKAGEGFAKSQGIPVERLDRVTTDRGEYLAVVRRVPGRAAHSILKERVPAWIDALRFAKTMRWDAAGYRFPRPVRWLLCLYGAAVLPIRLAGLAAGRSTRIAPLSEKAISVEDPTGYFALMKRHAIILAIDERRDAVRSQAREAARRCGGALVEDDDLVGEVANLLERPVALAGEYDDSFLVLPREVIVTALKSHQRYFSVSGPDGALIPRFIAFADGARRSAAAGIVRGYERVLRARLDDAVFYYKEDTARPLAEMAAKLDRIVWLEGLGSLAAKTKRIESLSLWIRGAWGVGGGALDESIRRAALLAKADLASEMVKDGKEFTLLQGYIGREYALAGGEPPEIADAVLEHYYPRFAGDALPRSETAAILAVADKIDTLSGCFIMGLEPSGSQDPYALRRQGLGILRIMIEKRAAFSIRDLIDRSLSLFADALEGPRRRSAADCREAILEFLSQRMVTILRGEGLDHDLVSAVLGAPWEFPFAAAASAAYLQDRRRRGQLSPFVLAMKRIANILPKKRREGFTKERGDGALRALAERRWDALGFSDGAFVEAAETALCDALSAAARALIDIEEKGAVDGSLGILESVVPAVTRYFDDVLVNCEDEGTKNNRIAFLASCYDVSRLFCDFSLIAGE